MSWLKSSLALLAVATLAPTMVGCSGGTGIKIEGSDTMVNLAQAWAEKYAEVKPDVKFKFREVDRALEFRVCSTALATSRTRVEK